MSGLECLNNREADFVDGVGEVIDLVCEEVVGDNGACTGCDTEGGIDKGLGDTGGELGGVRSTGLCKSLEGLL